MANWSGKPKQYWVQIDECFNGIFRDLETKKDVYTSIFDNDILAFFKELHDTYGAVFVLSTNYSSPAEKIPVGRDATALNVPHMNLSMVTNKYRAEFQANSHWLKANFHSYDISYSYVTPEVRAAYPAIFGNASLHPCPDPMRSQLDDAIMTVNQLKRIMGDECISTHNGCQMVTATPEGMMGMSKQLGIKTWASWSYSQTNFDTPNYILPHYNDIDRTWLFNKYHTDDAYYDEAYDMFIVPARILIEHVRSKGGIQNFQNLYNFEQSNLLLIASHDFYYDNDVFEYYIPSQQTIDECKQHFRETLAHVTANGYTSKYPDYNEMLAVYRPDLAITISTPTITKNGTIVTAESIVTGTTEPITYQWGTDGVNFPYAMPNGQYNFTGLYNAFYFRAGVNVDGIWYWSEVSQYEITQPKININIESNPLNLQSFGTFNINSNGKKSIGYIKANSSDTQIGDIVYLEYSKDQIQWTLVQLNEIPNNKYCKINLFSYPEEVYYFKFSVHRNGEYYYSNEIINSSQFYQEPEFNNLSYIKVNQYNYILLNCDISNLYENEDIKFQLSQNQINWTDVNISYSNNSVHRYRFNLQGKSGTWYYRMKISRIDEIYFSDITNFNLDEMTVKNVVGWNPYLSKSPVVYNNSKLATPVLGATKLGYIKKDNPSISKLACFSLGSHVLGSYVVIDIQLKTNVTFIKFYSNIVESNVIFDLLRYFSNIVNFDINYDLKKVDSIIKLLSTINPNIELEAKQLKEIKIKCITNPEITMESIINKEVELTSDMKFQIDLEATL